MVHERDARARAAGSVLTCCRRYFIVIALIAALGGGVISPCFAIIYSNVLQSFFKPSDVMESEAPAYTGQFMAIACCILLATLLRIGLWYMPHAFLHCIFVTIWSGTCWAKNSQPSCAASPLKIC